MPLQRNPATLPGWTVAAFFVMASVSLWGAEDRVLADFEGDGYGDWKASGEAFGAGPARGTLPGQMAVEGFEGRGLVNTFRGGDDSTGVLESPGFRIDRRFLRFLVGGGSRPSQLSLELLVDGRVVRNVTGPNDRPGGSEGLSVGAWDLADLFGLNARLRIVDQATGGWGHINVDQIVLTDRRPPGDVENARREFFVGQRYLHLPIRNGAPKRRVTLQVAGRTEVVNEMELAPGKPDWWAVLDVGAWKGSTVGLVVDRMPEDSTGLSSVRTSDAIPEGAGLYREPLRGQFHFSPQRGWNNDPNGLVYYRGEYHLFFQHNPYGWGWGNMHWGHAVSRDLVRWTELGDVLAPDRFGPMFSGSAVVDWNNTSGLGKEGKPPLVLLYTAAGHPTVQCLASSTDGRAFTKFPGNPVVPEITRDNRDPKVFWHAPTRKWVMTLYVETNRVHTIQFLGSANLRDWKLMSRNDGYFECPDLFELPVAGRRGERKWVLTAANGEYQVGTFDGERFDPETPKLPGHRGRGFYAAQSFSDIPERDGRRIFVGWFQTETRGMSFNQSMSLPLALGLASTTEGPRLTFSPVKELESLRGRSWRHDRLRLRPGTANPLARIETELVELRADFGPPAGGRTVFRLRGAEVYYDATKKELGVLGHAVPAPLVDGRLDLVVYLDRTGLEVFAAGGRVYVPMPFQAAPADRSLGLESAGGATTFRRLQVWSLKSAWEPKS